VRSDNARRIAANVAKLPEQFDLGSNNELLRSALIYAWPCLFLTSFPNYSFLASCRCLRRSQRSGLFGTSSKQLTQTKPKASGLFLTVIVAVVPFAMLVFYGLAVVMYNQLITASGSWRAVFLPLTESPWLIPAGAVIYINLTVWVWSHWRKPAIR
jgi:hypothetical protein